MVDAPTLPKKAVPLRKHRKLSYFLGATAALIITSLLAITALVTYRLDALKLSSKQTGDPELAKVLQANAKTGTHQITALCVTPNATRAAGLGFTEHSPVDIGSITKTFTAELLRKSESLTEETTIGEALLPHHETLRISPQTITESPLASRTLGELARHTSGLPRLAGISATTIYTSVFFNTNPYAGISREDVITAALQSPLTNIGTENYSNVGMALLGQLLALDAGTTYADLLQTSLLTPLGMSETALLAHTDDYPTATGYDEFGRAAATWEMDGYQPAGALRSTARDMRRWIDYLIEHGTPDYTWAPAKQGMVWHDGGTGGFRSILVIHPQSRQGVFLAADTAAAELEHVAFTILDSCTDPSGRT
ncbi:Penicillin-binding protein 4* [Corynebacterium canis]|uniref:serine hydrolase domain-containing protein n=1 Tax=Corynebacterium canis TaxID=679663 RepID=UPI001645C7FA|nr:serine hydrolase domain-containing protein [Corynebacterium canis]WJY75037.1 Penicillin-binding protein 4* [Corynebacterium canis]